MVGKEVTNTTHNTWRLWHAYPRVPRCRVVRAGPTGAACLCVPRQRGHRAHGIVNIWPLTPRATAVTHSRLVHPTPRKNPNPWQFEHIFR
jgi:hypothetical protein